MALADRIHERVQKLPEPLQAEALRFVEYLLHRVQRGRAQGADDWPTLSLLAATRGIEAEEGPVYTTDDIEETF